MSKKIIAYVKLTKPTIVLLFSLTGLATMVVQGGLNQNPLRFYMVFLGMILCAASANAFNQYIDRDIDKIMERTAKKRPIPLGLVSEKGAYIFSWILGVLSVLILYFFGNFYAAFWGLFTIVFYVVVYTIFLKRTTPYNIVIGGAAGATAPLIGWAAASNSLSAVAWALFFVTFMWTPPHFWALALCVKDEYKRANVPMLPVVAGVEATKRQILFYTLLTLPASLLPTLIGYSGLFYFVIAFILGLEFIRRAYLVFKSQDEKNYWKMFFYSIVYELFLFVALLVDGLLKKYFLFGRVFL
jgi:protoheme IX farnesyltransferase